MPETPKSALGWARRGIAGGALVMGAALLVTAWSSYRGVRAASQDVARAQAIAQLESLRRALRELDGAPTAADLAAWFDEQRADGLRYVAMRGGDLELEAGAVSAPVPAVNPIGPGPPITVLDRGDRLLVIASLPPPRGPRGEGRPDRADRLERRRQRLDPPELILEVEPVGARALTVRARRVLLINAAVALALQLAAIAAAIWLRRREAVDRAAAAQRHLADLGEMSAVLAHELRNPLASLKGHAQLLVEQLPEGKPRTKAELVVSEAVRVEGLTTGLLDFVRTGAIRRRAADPAAVLRAAAEEVEGAAVTIAVDPDAPASWPLDPDRLQQVLVNLIRNAMQAAEGPIEARVGRARDQLRLEVRDHGPGIPAGDEERIFAPFVTTRLRGTGLGLAVARRIVELHGGTITAGRADGGGARFTILIPREEA